MSGDPIAVRTARILALTRSQPRVQALPEAERETWARTQAENQLARVPYLPGRLSWSQIEAAYRELAATPPVYPFRRRNAARPSRPETAKRLLVSTATLDRACIVAGRGRHWPPRGL